MSNSLAPGSTIGILGGGQLGRMLAMAAARLEFRVHIFDPDPDAPAADVARHTTTAAWDDSATLKAFAGACDVVTYEFENVPVAALDLIEAETTIRPGRRALEVSQDRLSEKEWLESIGLTVAPYHTASDAAELALALAHVGYPAILKTRRLGYDGKGQTRIDDTHGAQSALDALQGADGIAEGVVAFEREISVIAARGADGTVATFEPGENVHKGGILHTTTVPADIGAGLREEAMAATGAILTALDYVGVLGVELFVSGETLTVNEIAPRVHNSGHWTEAACTVDQFEQHIRAITGLPLVDPSRHSDAVMTNLIGDDMDDVPTIREEAAARLHLYGKAETRAGRKMGHVTRLTGPARDRA